MAAFNVAEYIEESINSVIRQTHQNWELIICDDYSSDGTWQLMSEQKDRRIKKIRNAINLGASKSRNVCLKEATGRYVAVLDADDVWCSRKLSRQLKLFRDNRELGVIGTNAVEINQAGVEIGQRDFPSSNRQLMDLSFWRCPMLHSSIMFKREQLEKGYDASLVAEDWALILHLLSRSKGAVIQEPLVRYRIHDKNLTHRKSSQQKKDAFLVVQSLKLIQTFSEAERTVFEDFFYYRNPPKRKAITGIKVLLKVQTQYMGRESWKRLIWYLKSLIRPR
jgi:glycosyltransferase involved in cell wall biosynthesis